MGGWGERVMLVSVRMVKTGPGPVETATAVEPETAAAPRRNGRRREDG